MASDQQEKSKVIDMNGCNLRVGDLVMVLLNKPILTGFVTAIDVPSILVPKKEQTPGVVTITGSIKMAFDPRATQVLREVAKLVDPRAEVLIEQLARASEAKKEEPAPVAESASSEAKAGPVLITDPKD